MGRGLVFGLVVGAERGVGEAPAGLQPGQGVWERCYARASELRARAFTNVRSQCGGQAKTDPSDKDEARADPSDSVAARVDPCEL